MLDFLPFAVIPLNREQDVMEPGEDHVTPDGRTSKLMEKYIIYRRDDDDGGISSYVEQSCCQSDDVYSTLRDGRRPAE